MRYYRAYQGGYACRLLFPSSTFSRVLLEHAAVVVCGERWGPYSKRGNRTLATNLVDSPSCPRSFGAASHSFVSHSRVGGIRLAVNDCSNFEVLFYLRKTSTKQAHNMYCMETRARLCFSCLRSTVHSGSTTEWSSWFSSNNTV